MTALPAWMDRPDGLSVEECEALPEHISRRIEVVDGAIIVNAAPRRPTSCSTTHHCQTMTFYALGTVCLS